MSKSRLFIDVEQIAPGAVAPMYALTPKLRAKIFEELKKIGWEPQSYGNVDDGGAAVCIIDTPKRKEARYQNNLKWLKSIGWD